MRIHSLEIGQYGALRDRDIELDPRISVICGPNESGKSSFHSAIETVLFGFHPAGRKNHPYTRWNPECSLSIRALVESDAGKRVWVERTLQSTATSRLAPSREELSGRRLGNQALPELGDLKLTLFRAVYSLSANDTKFQRDEVRHEISELLLGERGIEGARPIHQVRKQLAEDQGKLWRPTARGKSLTKQLAAELREAKRALSEARRHENGLREEEAEFESLGGKIEACVARRKALEREEKEADFLERVAELRMRMDSARPLRVDALAGTPMQDPTPLQEELNRIEADLKEPRERLAAPAPRLELFDRKTLAREKEIQAVVRDSGVHADERQRAEKHRIQAEGALRSAQELLAAAGVSGTRETVMELDSEALTHSLAEWQAAIAQRTRTSPSAWPARVALLWALACLAAPLLTPAPLWVAFLAALALPIVLRRERDAGSIPAPPELALALAPLGLTLPQSPALLRRTLATLERARALFEEAQREEEEAAELRRALSEREAGWEELARELFEDQGPPAELPARLEQALERARRNSLAVEQALEQLQRDQKHLQRVEPQERKLRKRLATLLTALEENFKGLEPAQAFAAWQQTSSELEYIRRAESELRADPLWDELALDPRLDLEGDARPWCEAARNARAREKLQLESELETLRERRGELRARLEGGGTLGVAAATERVLDLEERIQAARRERDRLALLERILMLAERRHREAHQPDVLRRASRYLESITKGRYDTLCYAEGEEGPLYVQPLGQDEPVEVGPPLSRGTQEQIYLCLRLGTLDHLDREREHLPLVLDEALVHWDPTRRAELYPLLERIAEERQVLLFACDPSQAREAAKALSAPILELEAPGTRARDEARAR